jgi:hypothetical protein
MTYEGGATGQFLKGMLGDIALICSEIRIYVDKSLDTRHHLRFKLSTKVS